MSSIGYTDSRILFSPGSLAASEQSMPENSKGTASKTSQVDLGQPRSVPPVIRRKMNFWRPVSANIRGTANVHPINKRCNSAEAVTFYRAIECSFIDEVRAKNIYEFLVENNLGNVRKKSSRKKSDLKLIKLLEDKNENPVKEAFSIIRGLPIDGSMVLSLKGFGKSHENKIRNFVKECGRYLSDATIRDFLSFCGIKVSDSYIYRVTHESEKKDALNSEFTVPLEQLKETTSPVDDEVDDLPDDFSWLQKFDQPSKESQKSDGIENLVTVPNVNEQQSERWPEQSASDAEEYEARERVLALWGGD
ncbi:MAG: hypothetical protein P4M14_00995 [Gammaproteobacteria bacterium]|nr:hypothetical protein [Gammaproteobacteria bacterium]